MYVGLPNTNLVMPVTKLKITNKDKGKSFYVLYNPESYSIERNLNYSESAGMDSNMPSIQFVSGSTETLQMQLFFDTFSAGTEAGSGVGDKLKFVANSKLPSLTKQLDVRDYTSQVYDLMLINPGTHVPPLLKLEWSSLQFDGHLVACNQNFTKFNEKGMPVRATLDCTFKRYMKMSEIAKWEPKGSPDTAKFRRVTQGDSLWAFAAKEFADCDAWRDIARANRIENPRLLDTGETLVIPAIK